MRKLERRPDFVPSVDMNPLGWGEAEMFGSPQAYAVALRGPTADSAGGRPAWKVVLAAPRHKPYQTQVFIDAGTGLLTRFVETGTPYSVGVTELRVDVELADDTFDWAGPVDHRTARADETAALLLRAAEEGARYRASLPDRLVAAPVDDDALREGFGGGLPEEPTPPDEVIDELVWAANRGLVASAGPRFFGLVIGGSLLAATAADVLATGWDQCAFNGVTSPAATMAEDVAGGWLKDLLGIPATASVGFVPGGQAANTVGLVAARHHVLAKAGWDVERDGLAGAPKIRVVAGDERHATIDRSLRLLGFGTAIVEDVGADANGAIDVHALRRVLESRRGGPTIVCLQAGNVNTGACDNLRAACEIARSHDAWVHVDGAFGLWANANPDTAHLVDGAELADSWACDGHKWLNVPYDSGYAFCAHPGVHVAATSYTAAYLTGAGAGAGADLTLESSRRAPGFATWAALRELGRDGVADLVGRTCALAHRFADALVAGGAEVANDVVLNQVLVSFGDDARTDAIVEAVQADGTCWMGATTWRGKRFMRISVSNATTTQADVDRSVAAILRIASGLPGAHLRREPPTLVATTSERLHDVPEASRAALAAVVADFIGVPGPPGSLRFHGPSTEEYRAFVGGEQAEQHLEVLGVTDTHTFRLTVGQNPAHLAVTAADVLVDDVMGEIGAPWPEVRDPTSSVSTLLMPMVGEEGQGMWEGAGLRCRIGELQATFGHLLRKGAGSP